MKYIFYLIVIVTIIVSCTKRTAFSENDLSWIQPYDIGQEVIFESTEGLKDTILIIDKTNAHAEKLFTDKYRHASAKIVYYNRKFPNHMKSQNMIEMFKHYPNEDATFFFWFLLEGVMVLNYNNIPIENIIIDNKKVIVFKFNVYRKSSEGDKFSPKIVYWEKDLGVVRYISHDDVEWNLLEIKQANPADWSEDVWSRVKVANQ